MKNFSFLLFNYCLIFTIYCEVPDGYKLVWSDEFEDNSLDLTKWNYDIGGEPQWGNNELQYYTNRVENVYVSSGLLHIRAKKESYKDHEYTSGRLVTRNKFDFKYGYVEAKVSLPRGKGIWPAFWMLAANDLDWPICGEIDIIEAVNTENVIYSTCHWSSEGGHAQYGEGTDSFDLTQFHIYSMLWDENNIKIAVDGKTHFDILIKDGVGDTTAFHSNFYFLINIAVGGDWPGFEIDDNQFPNEMQVDYIRVYKP